MTLATMPSDVFCRWIVIWPSVAGASWILASEKPCRAPSSIVVWTVSTASLRPMP